LSGADPTAAFRRRQRRDLAVQSEPAHQPGRTDQSAGRLVVQRSERYAAVSAALPRLHQATTAAVQSPQASVDTTLNTLNGALSSAQAQANDFAAEQASLQGLELKNQTAVGNLQAVQTSNEIALAEVQQIQMLRQLVIAQTNAQNVAAANQVNNQTQIQLESQALISAPASPGTPDFLDATAEVPPQP